MKKKTLTYNYDTMVEAGRLLATVTVTGTANFRALARLADILDSGTVGEVYDKDTAASEPAKAKAGGRNKDKEAGDVVGK